MVMLKAFVPKALPFFVRQWLPLVLVGLLLGQQFQMWQTRRENTALRHTIEAQKAELAEVRGAIVKLTEAARALRPGETRTIYVDRPVTVRLPGQVIEKQVPVIVTRTEHTIETKVRTVELPAKEIERIIRESPQTIVADLTASRDIAKGEKFRVIVAQIQPGVWQPILELGAPITADVRTVTPIERIPAPAREPSRWTFAGLLGPALTDPRGPTILTRLEIEYRLGGRGFLRGEGDWLWNGSGGSGRLLYGVRW